MTPARILGVVLAAGFLAAPALALLYGPVSGLVVLGTALAITIGIAWSARPAIAAEHQWRLDLLLATNGAVLIATIVGLVLTIL